MRLRPPRATRTDTLFPSTPLFGSGAGALEPRLVRHVRGRCRHNELHRPRPISVQLRHERGRVTLELPDEDLLHLRMKVRLRLLYEDEVDTGRCRCRLILPEEAQ